MCVQRGQENKLYHSEEKNLVGLVAPVSFGTLGRCLSPFYVPVILFLSTQTPLGIILYFVCNPFLSAFIKTYMCVYVYVY